MEITYLLRRDRWLTIGGLAIVVVIAGAYVLHGAGMGMSALDMTRMAREMEMPQPAWTLEYAALMFAMWWLMMAAMMLPSATPVLLLVAALNRKASPGRRPYGATALFAAGYLVAWAGFSVVAVAAQAGLTANGSLASMLHVGDGALAGANAARGGVVAVDAGQARVPSALPFAGALPRGATTPRRIRRARDGGGARRVLRRLLLVDDGAAVRRRHHEPVLDRRARVVRARRESASRRRAGRAYRRSDPRRRRRCIARLGRLSRLKA